MTDITDFETSREMARIAYETALDARRAAEAVERDAFTAWGTARIDYSRAKGHPLAGQTVQRVRTQRTYIGLGHAVRSNGTRDRTETGVVTLCDSPRGGRYRGHDTIAGEWFVLSKSGATAYALDDRDGKCMWEPVA